MTGADDPEGRGLDLAADGHQDVAEGAEGGGDARVAGEPGQAAPALAEAEFEVLYAEHFERVLALVYTLSGSRWAAEELAQDAFVVAYRNWDRIADYDDAGAWVRRVAVNAARSRRRRTLAEARALVRLRGRREALPAALEPADHEFWREVRALPKQQARAVALHYLDDLPVAAIAQVLGCSEATVKVHLHRGRRALATRLTAAGFHGGRGGRMAGGAGSTGVAGSGPAGSGADDHEPSGAPVASEYRPEEG